MTGQARGPSVGQGDGSRHVWVVNEGGHNYSDAERHGEIRFITRGRINPFAIDRLIRDVAEVVRVADADDFLLLSGTPVINVVASVAFLQAFKKIRILQWNAIHEEYEEGEITLEGLVEVLERNMF